MVAARPRGRQRAAALLALALPLAGCGDAPPPHTLRMGIAQEVLTLDPRRASDAASARVARLIYQRLVEIGPDYRPQPALADWTQESPTRYRFVLRGGARFHDGAPLTAADVAATYRSLLAPGGGYALRGELGALHAVRAEDARTVVFDLAAPDAFFPGRLTLGILPAHIAQGRFEPVGSGPLRVVANAPGRLTLKRADGLRVVLRPVPDPLSRALMLRRGALDLAQNDFPPELIAYLAAQRDLRVIRAAGTNFHYLGVSCAHPVAGRPALREALALALDRPALIRALLGGAARPAGSVLPPGHYARAEPPPWPHDPARARALLRAAGLEGARLTLKTSTDPQRVRIASAIAAQLEAVGLRIRLRPLEWGTFYADVQDGRFELYTLAWVGVTQPDILRSLYHSAMAPPAGLNRGRCGSAALDARIERAFAAPLPAPPALRAVQVHVHRELPAVPLWTEDHVAVLGARVAGYDVRPDGAFDALTRVRLRHAAHPR